VKSTCIIFVWIFLILPIARISAQTDCPDAIIVCGDNNYTGLNASGFGIQEIGPNACDSREHNSLWLKILIKDGGTLGFILTPESEDLVVDFDFWMFGPNVSCGALGNSIRCSTTNPGAAGLLYNTTGMNDTETDVSEGPNEDGNAFIKWLDVQDDEVYYLVLDRPHGEANFSLQWTGTATFHQVPEFLNPDDIAIEIMQCDNDGINDAKSTFDLTVFEEMFIGPQTDVALTYHLDLNGMTTGEDPIADPEHFVNATNPQTIYMRLTNTAVGCYDTEILTIGIDYNLPTGIPDNLALCDDNGNGIRQFDLSQNTALINEGNPNTIITYYASQEDAENKVDPLPMLYENAQANVTQTIWARLETIGGCFGYGITSFAIEVLPIPEIIYTVNVTDFKQNTNSITINMAAIENYEFSLNGALYSDNPVLGGLVPGIYTLWIRSKDKCNQLIDKIPVLNYPKFFTPNGDGTNDLWNVFFIYAFPDAIVNIYDRYGKLVKSYLGRESGWDGTLNGERLPSTDYWFEIVFATGRKIHGHFAMIR